MGFNDLSMGFGEVAGYYFTFDVKKKKRKEKNKTDSLKIETKCRIDVYRKTFSQ